MSLPGAFRAQTRHAGFTLVEVMVALFIAALTLPALLFTLDQQIDGTGYLRDRSLAQLVASNRMSELQLSLRAGRPAPQGRLSGEEQMLGRDWFWSLQTQATEVPQFTRVEIQVRDEEGAEAAPLFTLVAFLSAGAQ